MGKHCMVPFGLRAYREQEIPFFSSKSWWRENRCRLWNFNPFFPPTSLTFWQWLHLHTDMGIVIIIIMDATYCNHALYLWFRPNRKSPLLTIALSTMILKNSSFLGSSTFYLVSSKKLRPCRLSFSSIENRFAWLCTNTFCVCLVSLQMIAYLCITSLCSALFSYFCVWRTLIDIAAIIPAHPLAVNSARSLFVLPARPNHWLCKVLILKCTIFALWLFYLYGHYPSACNLNWSQNWQLKDGSYCEL